MGTWYVAPPTLRDVTSRTGFTFSIAFRITSRPFCPDLFLDDIERAVDDSLRGAPLAALENVADDAGNEGIVVLRIGYDISFYYFTPAWHLINLPECYAAVFFGLLTPYFERLLFLPSTPVESSAPRMIW